MGTNRLESFSDGVIAVAITLLVLGLQVPSTAGSQTLVSQLGRHWLEFAAYATSFVTIGIVWINHHVMITRLSRADHSILILNILLLLTIGLLPFATEVVAAFLRGSHDHSAAAAIYSGSFLLMALAFAALNRQILIRRPHLLAVQMPEAQRRAILRRSLIGIAPYAIATGLAAVSPDATLIICAALAGFYALPFASGNDVAAPDSD